MLILSALPLSQAEWDEFQLSAWKTERTKAAAFPLQVPPPSLSPLTAFHLLCEDEPFHKKPFRPVFYSLSTQIRRPQDDCPAS